MPRITPLRSAQNDNLGGTHSVSRRRVARGLAGVPDMGETRPAQPKKSNAFLGSHDLPWMARLGAVEAFSAAPWMA